MWLEQDKLFWFAVFISKPLLGHSTIFWPSNWNFLGQRNLNFPILLFWSRRPMHKALRTVEGFAISVLVHWMTSLECKVLLEATYGLPLSIFYLISEDGLVTSVFMILWLQFFCYGARLGFSTSFWQWSQNLRPQRNSKPHSPDSKSDALSVRLCGLLKCFRFLFFFAVSGFGEE